MEREFNLSYFMNFGVQDQRRTDTLMLEWHYSRLYEQLRREEEGEK